MAKRTALVWLLSAASVLVSGSLPRTGAQEKSAQDTSDASGTFGLLAIKSIDAVLGEPFAQYESGALRLDSAKLALTVSFAARPDGSLEHVRVARSSGVARIDDAALGLAAAVSQAKAAGPLSKLRKTEVSVVPEGESVHFEVSGESASPEEAKTAAEQMSSQLSVLRLFGSRLTHASQRALELIRVSSSGKRVVGTVVISRAEVYALMRERYAADAR